MEDIRLKNRQIQDKLNKAKITDSPVITNTFDLINNFDSKSAYQQSPDAASLYSDFINDENSSSHSIGNFNDELLPQNDDLFLTKRIDISKPVIQDPPPEELLCPFEDKQSMERHLMNNAIIVPCCGYFICCEECKYIRKNQNKTRSSCHENLASI